ncbi:hypothetical protein I5M27_02665 [Adhaeribacter sp. BT258]|uniref:Uncharacterized protein n=1 Tax=Adhaeribacter terrigena TaxID=2793070 RepID=A0ABS1BXK2_9BACT|nr:hypothetical protein [Adhaeribacter terrigena]MBK0401869.1 hypothetical protein [Adhaeribacter terrigena]
MALKDSTFVIAKSALIDSEEGTFVIRTVNNSTEKVAVKKGREQDGKVEIFGSLNPGDKLLPHACSHIKEGTMAKK